MEIWQLNFNFLEAHTANSDEQSVVGSNPIIPSLVRSSMGRAIVIQEPRFFIEALCNGKHNGL